MEMDLPTCFGKQADNVCWVLRGCVLCTSFIVPHCIATQGEHKRVRNAVSREAHREEGSVGEVVDTGVVQEDGEDKGGAAIMHQQDTQQQQNVQKQDTQQQQHTKKHDVPDGWQVIKDEETGNLYYYNPTTKVHGGRCGG